VTRAASSGPNTRRDRPILITGGAGFVGASLVRALEGRGQPVRVLDSGRACGFAYLRGTSAEILAADLLEPGDAARAVEGVAAVVHLAAQTGVPASIERPLSDLEQNVVGTVGLLEAARAAGVERFLFASSNAAVGLSPVQPVHEDVIPHPVSPYGAAKLAVEGYLMAYAEAYGMVTTAVRFSNSYGPYALHKISVVAAFLKAYLSRQPLVVYGDGSQTRDFVHADDIVRQLLLTLDAPVEAVRGQVFQAGTGRETAVAALAQTVLEVGDRPGRIEQRPPRPGDVARSYSDVTKAGRVLGYRPQVELADGISRTLAWFEAALGDPELAALATERASSGSD
jgi:UDP-glucose 4-epimerase